MFKLLTEDIAKQGLITILSLIVVFHFLVILGVIPNNIVWGGKINDNSQLLVMELLSITINLLMLLVIAIHTSILKIKLSKKITLNIIRIMFLLFCLNTLGNLFAENIFEQTFFTFLTFLLAILTARFIFPIKETIKE